MRALALLVLIILTTSAFGQRTIDLKLVVLDVSNNYVLKQNEEFQVKLGLVNQGTDTIYDFDEYALALRFGGDHYFPKFLDFDQTVYPGDTFYVTRNYSLDYEYDYDSIRLCFESYAYSSTASKIKSERNVSFSDNIGCVQVDYKAEKLWTSTVAHTNRKIPYPNPCHKSKLFIPYEGEAPKVSLISSNGSITHSKILTIGAGELILDVAEVPPGFYYLSCINDDKVNSYKLIID
jgi:hypothetical protein